MTFVRFAERGCASFVWRWAETIMDQSEEELVAQQSGQARAWEDAWEAARPGDKSGW